MKLFKRISTKQQRLEAAELLVEIRKLTNPKEATYYDKELLPYKKYGYDKYLELLKSVLYQIKTGQRERKEPRAIVATARNKVLT